jgi:hypothetical protein
MFGVFIMCLLELLLHLSLTLVVLIASDKSQDHSCCFSLLEVVTCYYLSCRLVMVLYFHKVCK